MNVRLLRERLGDRPERPRQQGEDASIEPASAVSLKKTSSSASAASRRSPAVRPSACSSALVAPSLCFYAVDKQTRAVSVIDDDALYRPKR